MLLIVPAVSQDDNRASARVEEAGLVREYHRLDPVSEIELHQDVRDVGLHGGVADVELARDLGIREAARDQPEDIQLAFRQLIELSRRFRARHPRELLDHPLGDGRGEQSLPVGYNPYSGKELFRRIVLEYEAAGAGAERLVDVLVEIERRQDQDPRSVVGGEDA